MLAKQKMTLKVVWTVQIQCHAVTVKPADCSILWNLRLRNSCLQVKWMFTKQWGSCVSQAKLAASRLTEIGWQSSTRYDGA